MDQAVARKGWFVMPGVQDGHRTLDEQVRGLDPMFSEVGGRSVLDLGCAEGLISITCARRGARAVFGIDNNGDAIQTALRISVGEALPPVFAQADLNDLDQGLGTHDIVLALAVVHKLHDPRAALEWIADHCASLTVLRLPVGFKGVVTSKHRVGQNKIRPSCNVARAMEEKGFSLERTEAGPFDEPTQYWRRNGLG